jgi:hypothetical protein
MYFMGFWNISIMMSDSVLVGGIILKAGGDRNFSTWRICGVYLKGKTAVFKNTPLKHIT